MHSLMSPMRTLRAIVAATLLPLAGCAQQAPPPADGAFSFALVGDMPYGTAGEGRFAQMLQGIDADRSIRFLLHAGDLKSSSEPCSDELLRRRLAQLHDVRTALVYTPGDNDWTDCHRAGAGGRDPLERLQALRRLAYPAPGRSLGRQPLLVQGLPGRPENVQFAHGRVVFVTLHVIGSDNGLAPWSAAAGPQRLVQLAEFRQREAANLQWLRAAFERARAEDAVALVVLMHGNPRFDLPAGNSGRAGFEAVIAALGRLSAELGRPVLLLHGDGHFFLDDRPLAEAPSPAPNLRRVQAFGYPWSEWIRIDVDPASSAVFRIGIGGQHDVIKG